MANCATPVIIAGAVEGSLHILVSAPDYADGTVVYYSPTFSGIVAGEVALISLSTPIKANQSISVYINDTSCKVSSCAVNAVAVEPYAPDCISDKCPTNGTPTGLMICDGIDLVQEVHDGNCGFMAGAVILEDCRYCGGVKPNCDED